MIDHRNNNTPLFCIDLKMAESPRYGKQAIKYPGLIQHSPQPNRVRHIKSLFGNPVCVVDTEDWNINKNYYLHFPPNNYDDVKLKNFSKFNFSSSIDSNLFVSARPNLDTIAALNYFTGLQNMSFRSRPIFNMKRIENMEGWEKELKTITESALEPFLKDKNEFIDRQQTIPEIRRNSVSNSMKRMYSSSGRILPMIGLSRPLTSPDKRLNSRLSSSRSVKSEGHANEFDLDLQVFNVLGGILQTNENEVIKTWLLTATEREKALMIDIVRSSLLDKEELNIFVKDHVPDFESKIIYTPNKNFNPKLPAIPESTCPEKIDCLLVHNDPPQKFEIPPARPPTSLTFRSSTRASTSRPSTRDHSSWIPSDSLVVN